MKKINYSKMMSSIKSKDTSIEIKVRKYLYHHGFRYRKNVSSLPGKPDLVINKYNVVVFINGCFWHHHFNCRYGTFPKSNLEYWLPKIERNIQNDITNHKLLQQMNYRVIVVWECEINDVFDYRMKQLIEEIKDPNYK